MKLWPGVSSRVARKHITIYFKHIHVLYQRLYKRRHTGPFDYCSVSWMGDTNMGADPLICKAGVASRKVPPCSGPGGVRGGIPATPIGVETPRCHRMSLVTSSILISHTSDIYLICNHCGMVGIRNNFKSNLYLKFFVLI